jgi:hypothetical protein
MGQYFRGFRDDGGIYIYDGGVPIFEHEGDLFEENEAGNIFPAGIVVREVTSDVSLANGTEERIGNGVDENVRIGMSVGPACVGDFDTAENAATPFFERMHIIAYANVVHERIVG